MTLIGTYFSVIINLRLAAKWITQSTWKHNECLWSIFRYYKGSYWILPTRYNKSTQIVVPMLYTRKRFFHVYAVLWIGLTSVLSFASTFSSIPNCLRPTSPSNGFTFLANKFLSTLLNTWKIIFLNINCFSISTSPRSWRVFYWFYLNFIINVNLVQLKELHVFMSLTMYYIACIVFWDPIF